MNWDTTNNNFSWDTTKNVFDDLLIVFSGKDIGVLGVDASGKSTLCKLITEKILDGQVATTNTRDFFRKINIKFQKSENNQTIRIRKIIDVGGHRGLYKEKRKTFESVGCFIYVLRSDLILPEKQIVRKVSTVVLKEEIERHKNAVKQDFYNFTGWKKNNKKLIIVGNYFGHSPDGEKVIIPYDGVSVTPNFMDNNYHNNYLREFRKILTKETETIIDSLSLKVNWVVGSLTSRPLANKLVLDIFRCLVEE
ncbi:MAG: hypothetical protein F6J89_22495 [Symploca sp. SIO1C4]|uniref:Uncharacterized protein n=1 Tax=Symploca sp. SIO1C4 TaxID=2607765 RepID=A0A6B3N9N8_9CYAN|nr:hypothetical protein [Symploca sp. SIO1C4]